MGGQSGFAANNKIGQLPQSFRAFIERLEREVRRLAFFLGHFARAR
jgi:hypothetical protein